MTTHDSIGTSRWPWIVGALVIVGAIVAGVFLFGSDSDDDDAVATTVASTTAPSTQPTSVETTEAPASTVAPTTVAPTTVTPATTQIPQPPEPTDAAIWPWADTGVRYSDPLEAAEGFAIDFLGFDAPMIGEFLEGDATSGEVTVRASDPGPITTVFVRRLTDDDWWIVGAVGENIMIDDPETGDTVESPLRVAGSAAAFEGTVAVELRADGNGEPIFEGFVTGSGGPIPGPFDETFEFASPGDTGGALVMLSRSPVDDSVVEASTIRIFYS